jgi:hypothetical protein
MCRRRWSLLGVALLAAPSGLRAQNAEQRERLQTLLARVDSLWSQRAAVDSAAAREVRAQRRARLWTYGDVAVALWGGVSQTEADSLMSAAASQLTQFGLVPRRFTRKVVMIQVNASDTAALRAAPAMRDRQPLLLDWVPGDPAEGAQKVAYGITRAYGRSLDSAASVWLPTSAGETWSMAQGGARALRWLAEAQTSAGSECLAGDASGCRRWLGLDDARQPFAARYSADDIRRLLGEYRYGGARLQACIAGDDGSCLRYVEEDRATGLSPIPAGEDVRNSLLHYVRLMRGAEAVGRVFAGPPALVGARFARATGLPTDSLVLGWRAWVLSRGRPGRVGTPAAEAIAALCFAGLLAGLATRRPRWA